VGEAAEGRVPPDRVGGIGLRLPSPPEFRKRRVPDGAARERLFERHRVEVRMRTRACKAPHVGHVFNGRPGQQVQEHINRTAGMADRPDVCHGSPTRLVPGSERPGEGPYGCANRATSATDMIASVFLKPGGGECAYRTACDTFNDSPAAIRVVTPMVCSSRQFPPSAKMPPSRRSSTSSAVSVIASR